MGPAAGRGGGLDFMLSISVNFVSLSRGLGLGLGLGTGAARHPGEGVISALASSDGSWECPPTCRGFGLGFGTPFSGATPGRGWAAGLLFDRGAKLWFSEALGNTIVGGVSGMGGLTVVWLTTGLVLGSDGFTFKAFSAASGLLLLGVVSTCFSAGNCPC